MHVLSIDGVTPIAAQHGEVIHELIGRAIGDEPTQRHSVAYVVIPPGKSSLLHRHPEAEESYYIVKGQARLLVGEEEASVAAGAAVLIPSLKLHKIINIGNEDLEFWGSSLGPVQERVARLNRDKFSARMVHLSELWPFPKEAVIKALQGVKKLVGVEGNATGQLNRLLRQETGLISDHLVLRYDGRPFTPEFILRELPGRL